MALHTLAPPRETTPERKRDGTAAALQSTMQVNHDEVLMKARRRLSDLFGPKRWVFWTDFAITSSLVWIGLVAATRGTGSWPLDALRRAHRRLLAELPEGSPYSSRTLALQRALDADLARRRADPVDVARAIVRAATDPNPRLRYVVGSDARLAVLARRLLPERAFERVSARHFDRAGPRSAGAKRALRIAALITALVLSPAARADQAGEAGWETLVQGPVSVKVRPKPGTPLKEYWVEGELNAPLADVQAALTDIQRFSEFMPHVREARVLGGAEPDGSTYVYTKLEFPIFVRARDYVVRVALEEGVKPDGTGAFRQRWVATPDRIPERRGVVRIRVLEGSWHIVSKGEDRVFVIHRFATDPGGRLPSFAVDMGNRSGCVDLFKSVEKAARRRYEQRLATR
jgi:hypothetical protein